MKLAFALFKYFPFGGLQNDMMRMAQCAAQKEHEVVIFCGQWDDPEESPLPPHVTRRVLPIKGWSNHAQALCFERLLHKALSQEKFDTTVAFNRISGCDFYFAADNCLNVEMRRKHPPLILNGLPRYRTYLSMERRLFSQSSHTKIMYITARQPQDYQRCYHTAEDRFVYLPPGIDRKYHLPADIDDRRQKIRQQLGVAEHQTMLIQVGFNFEGKGADRIVRALASLPAERRSRCKLFLIGPRSPRKGLRMAESIGMADLLTFTGGRRDIPDLLYAADLMVHPARNEATGTVLLESMACGTPVICSEACGFANFVREAAGLVTPEPFQQDDLDRLLFDALSELPKRTHRTRQYAETMDFYARADAAVTLFTHNKKSS